MPHPYENRPSTAYWKQAVASKNALQIRDVYSPRFGIDSKTRISAAGSCFAQHIGRQFKARNFHFIDTEPAPPLLQEDVRREFGYDLYSARYGNVYSARQLAQLFDRSDGTFVPEDEYWKEEGQYFDPFRPTIEPQGFASLAELRTSRDAHLRAVSTILPQTDVFVFTFGLTEAWIDTRDGAVLPVCPGTARGTFEPERHMFANFSWTDVITDFERFMTRARESNPKMKFLVTVSPVPLTATATDDHVLLATMSSKSILRAVCSELCDRYNYVDYFPSYELVASPPIRGMFFDPNLRTVAQEGVAHVMSEFFRRHTLDDGRSGELGSAQAGGDPDSIIAAAEDVICDEAILEGFGR